MERNILLTIEYDGTNFCGWQRQPGLRTVQGQLEQALTKVCGKEITLNGTSRTDAGVHALGQRASFRGEFGIPTDRIMLAVNNLLCGGMNEMCIRDSLYTIQPMTRPAKSAPDAPKLNFPNLILPNSRPRAMVMNISTKGLNSRLM